MTIYDDFKKINIRKLMVMNPKGAQYWKKELGILDDDKLIALHDGLNREAKCPGFLRSASL